MFKPSPTWPNCRLDEWCDKGINHSWSYITVWQKPEGKCDQNTRGSSGINVMQSNSLDKYVEVIYKCNPEWYVFLYTYNSFVFTVDLVGDS